MRPHRLASACARLLLILMGLACATVMLGPFQDLEYALVPWDKAAHFIAVYGVTSLLFIGFPRRRRLDLAIMATFGACAIELMQGIIGRDAELGDMAANAAGAFAVLLPGYLEDARVALRAAQSGRRVEARRDRRRKPLPQGAASQAPKPSADPA